MRVTFESLIANKDNAIFLLEEYRKQSGDYPSTNELASLKEQHPGVFPSIKTIQNNGGIATFYRLLGIRYLDARTGARRARIANDSNNRSQRIDADLYDFLVSKYGERNVHTQPLYNSKGRSFRRSDFRVYQKDGSSFFIDTFFPQDTISLAGIVNIKLKKLDAVPVDKNSMIYFICCNDEDISQFQINEYVKNRKSPFPKNIRLIHIKDAYHVLPS